MGSVLGCPLTWGLPGVGETSEPTAARLPVAAQAGDAPATASRPREEALEEVAEGLADLVVGREGEALAGALGLAGVEGPHQRHVAARLHGDDRAVTTRA